jgi:hypothetical protein
LRQFHVPQFQDAANLSRRPPAHRLAVDTEIEKDFNSSGSVDPAVTQAVKDFFAGKAGGSDGRPPDP